MITTAPSVVVSSNGPTCSYSASPKPSLRKHRCWQFHVIGISDTGDSNRYERDVLLPFRQRYTSATRLVLSAVDGQDTASSIPDEVCVEVQFSGPQPCLGPGSLLCALLAGTSVRAHPVQLERGRKKKPRRSGSYVETEGDSATIVLPEPMDRRMRQKILHGPTSYVTVAGDGNGTYSNRVTTGEHRGPLSLASSGNINNHPINTRRVNCIARGPNSSLTAAELPTSSGESSTSSGSECECRNRSAPDSGASNREGVSSLSTSQQGDNQSARTGPIDLLATISSDSAEYDFRLDSCHWVNEGTSTSSASPDPLMKSWSAGSSHSEDEALQSRVLTCSDWDAFLHSADGGGGINPAPGSSIDACGGLKANHLAAGDDSGHVPETPRSEDEITVTLSHMECDFDGHADSAPSEVQSGSSLRNPPPSSSCQIQFTGLESTKHDPSTLVVTAHFWIDPKEKIVELASPIHVDPGGHTKAAVRYPSMQKLWPTVYKTDNIRTVEVDVSINVRSRNKELDHVGPNLKVTYRRPTAPTEHNDADPSVSCRRICDPPSMRFKINSGDGMVAV